ncbi:trypsin-like peptidase domain-containing protein [Xanthobacter versatilis]|uniref:trypsin-like peptidase domain-containing protein n=1 Tax=Xanthobacter autotrophicus (strain ATCC BAA-1158 / Py2) TaxID=78245 RepID=UPI00372659AE
MSAASIDRIIIRHLSGSKANQIEQIPVQDLQEVTIGRDPASTIAFDAKRDDVVSRHHAAIRIPANDDSAFRLVDLNSSNGTLLNGQPVKEDAELLPEDTIELGKNGPKFVFDVQPRPPAMSARTRIISAVDTTATRVVNAVGATGQIDGDKTGQVSATTASMAEPPKAGVGKETVMRMLGEERRSTSRVWAASLAGVVAFVALVGGAFYWRHLNELGEIREAQARDNARVATEASTNLSQQLGMSAQQIVSRYGDAVLKIYLQWRVFDQETGKPIFHKTVVYDGRTYPAYVRLPGDLGVVRWLTLDDENRSNPSIGEAGEGSGFVVSEQGFILTNKHVAAGWMVPYDASVGQYGIVFDLKQPAAFKKRDKATMINLEGASDEASRLRRWVPEAGGVVFHPNVAIPIGSIDGLDSSIAKRVFIGRNEYLEARFAGSRLSINATLVRPSSDADAALIKIDSPQPLNKIDISANDELRVGQKVIDLGYPAVSVETYTQFTTREAGGPSRVHDELVPQPSVNEGIISALGSASRREGDQTTRSSGGDVFQMSINTSGPGNSGGPVFNAEGKVIGLHTYGRKVGDARVTLGVPIRYGRDLLQPQRAAQ